VERVRASKLRTQRVARCAGRHILGTPTRTDIESGCTFTPGENYVRRSAHTQCKTLTQMHNIGRGRPVVRCHSKQHLSRSPGLWGLPFTPAKCLPLQTASGWWENHSPSVRCTDRAMPAHHELIARATAIRSSGASCSVRARTVNQHVGFGQSAFLPTAARNVNASATDCAFAGKCSVSVSRCRRP
jgi:hypothetical protein